LKNAEAMLAKERLAAEKWKAQVWIEITRTILAGKLEDLDAVIQEVTDAGLQNLELEEAYNFMNGKAQRHASQLLLKKAVETRRKDHLELAIAGGKCSRLEAGSAPSSTLTR